MTPSATPQRKKKDDYDHPLRRSPRGETGPPREQKVVGGSPAQLPWSAPAGWKACRSTAPITRR